MKRCWNCGRQIPGAWLFCHDLSLKPGCGKIQPPGLCVTYFDVLLPQNTKANVGLSADFDRDSIATKPTFKVDEKFLKSRFLKLQQVVHPDSFATREDLRLHGLNSVETEKTEDPKLLLEVLETMENLDEDLDSKELEELKNQNDDHGADRIQNTTQMLDEAFKELNFELPLSIGGLMRDFRPSEDVLLKVCILGDSSVGKTCLREQWMHKRFTHSYRATIGADFCVKTLSIPSESGDGPKRVSLQMWDTAGQERFALLSDSFYRGSDALILVMDVTNLSSGINLNKWLSEFFKHLPRKQRTPTFSNFPVIIIANKCDLNEDAENVDDDLSRLAKSLRNQLDMMERDLNSLRKQIPSINLSKSQTNNINTTGATWHNTSTTAALQIPREISDDTSDHAATSRFGESATPKQSKLISKTSLAVKLTSPRSHQQSYDLLRDSIPPPPPPLPIKRIPTKTSHTVTRNSMSSFVTALTSLSTSTSVSEASNDVNHYDSEDLLSEIGDDASSIISDGRRFDSQRDWSKRRNVTTLFGNSDTKLTTSIISTALNSNNNALKTSPSRDIRPSLGLEDLDEREEKDSNLVWGEGIELPVFKTSAKHGSCGWGGDIDD
ncbi:hypothetical protein HK096_004886, partial [Nowakowskiella sp. JEL0078]